MTLIQFPVTVDPVDPMHYFSMDEVNQLRARVRQAAATWQERWHQPVASQAPRWPNTTAWAWHKSPVDPTELVSAYPALRLKDGMALRAYVFYRQGQLRRCKIFAQSLRDGFPEPHECMDWGPGHAPLPAPRGVQDFMLAIDGDRSPVSYLSASFLLRDLEDLGNVTRYPWRDMLIAGDGPDDAEKRPRFNWSHGHPVIEFSAGVPGRMPTPHVDHFSNADYAAISTGLSWGNSLGRELDNEMPL